MSNNMTAEMFSTPASIDQQLQGAIDATAMMAVEHVADVALRERLMTHLDELLEEQVRRVQAG